MRPGATRPWDEAEYLNPLGWRALRETGATGLEPAPSRVTAVGRHSADASLLLYAGAADQTGVTSAAFVDANAAVNRAASSVDGLAWR